MLIDARDLPRKHWPAVLERLVQESMRERQNGTPPLARTRVRYVREPRGRELWQSAAETHRLGEGDCEDLSIWLASDLRLRGVPAVVFIKRTRKGYHALVRVGPRLFDPSKVRGMLKGALV